MFKYIYKILLICNKKLMKLNIKVIYEICEITQLKQFVKILSKVLNFQ